MPELPDVQLYLHALRKEYLNKPLRKLIIRSPFVLRTFEIDPAQLENKCVIGFDRIGKRIVWQLESNFFIVFHLMIAGRFHQRQAGRMPTGKNELAAFQFEGSTLMLTEAGTKKRASLHILNSRDELEQFRRGGIDVLSCSLEGFVARLKSRNRTLKRWLTDPTIVDGVGNAYSDEILLEAKLSPFKHSGKLTTGEAERLFQVTRSVLGRFIQLLLEQNRDRFPRKVTAFRPEMAAHGKYNQPCAICHTKIQRVRFAENEMNYCPRCQTEGKILADRSMSRLLNDDWPKTIEELEN